MKKSHHLLAGIAAASIAVCISNHAHASLDQMNGVTLHGNSSLMFVNLDSTGPTAQSLTLDLGYHFSDFANAGPLTNLFTYVVWDFKANTITHNGVLQTGMSNAWSAQRDIFLANSNASEAKWAVLAGSQRGNTPNQFLATGTPRPLQLAQQTATVTATFVQINQPLMNTLVVGNKGTILSADNGAYAAGPLDASYVGAAYSPTTINGWKNNIKWATWSADGAQTNFTQLNANGTEITVADVGDYSQYPPEFFGSSTEELLNNRGTFTYRSAEGILTWQTMPVPEPESYMLAALGLLAVAPMIARHRRGTHT